MTCVPSIIGAPTRTRNFAESALTLQSTDEPLFSPHVGSYPALERSGMVSVHVDGGPPR
jgi:hypothetical protein